MIVILSLFPGIDLLGKSFEEVFGDQATVVRGPDRLWGGDAKKFHVPAGVFDGVIGGPPCQFASQAVALHGNDRKAGRDYKKGEDLIPEFVRIVNEAKPKWVVMENIRLARRSPHLPKEWYPVKLRDYDCGGFTFRLRYFWVYPAFLTFEPPKRPGRPEHSVLATSWKTRPRTGAGFHGHKYISLEYAAELQGFPELVEPLSKFGRARAVEMLGNGVPRAMGRFIAQAVANQYYGGLK